MLQILALPLSVWAEKRGTAKESVKNISIKYLDLQKYLRIWNIYFYISCSASFFYNYFQYVMIFLSMIIMRTSKVWTPILPPVYLAFIYTDIHHCIYYLLYTHLYMFSIHSDVIISKVLIGNGLMDCLMFLLVCRRGLYTCYDSYCMYSQIQFYVFQYVSELEIIWMF